jgi:hypothetical protein
MVTITIEGEQISGIASFYEQINALFMASEDWRLGPSLDALDDMLYGGYGALNGVEGATNIWKNSDQARQALGLEATRQHYLAKLEHPEIFDLSVIRRDLDALECDTGPTYFDIIVKVFAGHPNIALELR